MYRSSIKVFFITGFSKKCRRHANMLADVLDTLGIEYSFGENFGGVGIAEGVRTKIEEASFVIALLPRDSQVEEKGTRAWLIEELAWSKASKKDALILMEKGVRLSGGIIGDAERLKFNADKFAEVLPQFMRALKSLLNRHYLTLGVTDWAAVMHVSDEQMIDECNDEAKFLISKVRQMTKQQKYSEALQYAKRATEVDPAAWRAWTSYGALQVRLGRVKEGDAIFKQVIKDFPKSAKALSTAIHNRAWVKAINAGYNPSEKSLMEQAQMYRRALSLDTERIYTRASLLIVYLQLGDLERAHKLLEESVMFEGFLGALRFELDTYGAKVHDLLRLLPTWVRFMLYPVRRSGSGGYEY